MITVLDNDAAALLRRCAEHMTASTHSNDDRIMLESWCSTVCRAPATTERFLKTSPSQWESLILNHPAHHHDWYDFIEHDITIDQMATFLLENSFYPVFLRLLDAIAQIQICEDAREAVAENIADEQQPVPHSELMRRMMTAVRQRATAKLRLSVYPELVNRTLVFYYGFFCDPWHLVGSVFATERMGTKRVICMDKGLARMGLDENEREFTITHAHCDDHHASDWLQRVIVPSIDRDPRLRVRIAKGIADCLDTSHAYLDYLAERVASEAFDGE